MSFRDEERQRMWYEPKQKQLDKRNNCRRKKTNFGNSVKRTKSNSHCFADEVIKKTRQLMKQRTQINCIESSRRKISQRIFQLMSVMKVTLPCQSQKSQLARFIPIGERKTKAMLFPKGHTWLYQYILHKRYCIICE